MDYEMISYKGILWLSLLAFCCYPCISIAGVEENQREDVKHLLDLSLEQLATLSVASKRQERIQDAPGVVMVISAEDISRYGARNLRDVLDRQTSMQVIGSNLWPHNKVSLRGVSASHVDNNVLLLINGRPIREATVSSFNHDIYSAFPLDAIKQIEIIRGPGSVLYGTNAMSGVINIVTKDSPEAPDAKLALTYGSYDTKHGELSGGGRIGGMKFFGALNVMNDEGDVFHNITDETGKIGDYKMGNQGEQLVLNSKYDDLSLNMLYSDTDTDNVRALFEFPSTKERVKRVFADLGYRYGITDNWDLHLNASLHHHTSHLVIDSSGLLSDNKAKNILLEINAQGRISNDISMIAGATRNYMSNDGSPTINSTLSSLYTQIEYQYSDRQKWVGGLQFNKPEETSGHLSPRLATIIKLNDQWHTKLLYSEAFRDASLVERYVNAPVLVGDPLLKPETIKTYDVQLLNENRLNLFSITYFHSLQRNLIVRSGGTPLQIINAGNIHYNGIELEVRRQFSGDWQFIGNFSYQANQNNAGEKGVSYAPDLMLKSGISYAPRRGYSLGIFDSYFAKSTLQNQDINPTVANVNPNADGYNLLTANLNIDLSHYIKDTSAYKPSLSVYVDNLLDEEIYFPSINRTTVNTLPHHAGRGIYATLELSF